MAVCTQHTGGPNKKFPNAPYWMCEKPALWLTPSWRHEKSRPVCGLHRRSVDKFHVRMKNGLCCTEIKES